MSVKLIHFGSKLIGVAFSVNGKLVTTADVAIAAELKVELIDRAANVAVLLSDEVISDFEFALLKEIEAVTVMSNQNLKCELNCLSWGSPRAKCEAILATTDDLPLSGSPMINAKGEVVGMASFHIDGGGGTTLTSQSCGGIRTLSEFRLCGYVPSPIIDMVMKLAVKSWFGGIFIEYGTLLSAKLSEGKIQPCGYIVFKLEPKGPLENAGVTRGSILLKVNDRKFHPSSCMFRHRPGETVKCNFYGGGVFNIALVGYPEQEECSQGSVSGFKKLTEVVREVKVKLPSYSKRAVVKLIVVDDDNSAIEVHGFAISSTETIIHSKYISEGSQVYYSVGSSVLVAEIGGSDNGATTLSIPSAEYFSQSQMEGKFIIRSATGELVPASEKVDGALIDSDGKLVRLIDSSETPKPVELLDFPLNFNY